MMLPLVYKVDNLEVNILGKVKSANLCTQRHADLSQFGQSYMQESTYNLNS